MKAPKVGDLFTVPDEDGFKPAWRGQMGAVKKVDLLTHTPGAEYMLTVTRLSDGYTTEVGDYALGRLVWAH